MIRQCCSIETNYSGAWVRGFLVSGSSVDSRRMGGSSGVSCSRRSMMSETASLVSVSGFCLVTNCW